MPSTDFNYIEGRFADVMMLRYRLDGSEKLSLRQKKLVYCLSQAALYGRDITFDQFGRYNLRIRKVLEVVYACYDGSREAKEFKSFEEYLKRVWFSSGIYHHYGYYKFKPNFTEDFFISAVKSVNVKELPLKEGQTVDELCRELVPVMFDDAVLPVKVSKKDGEDLVKSSACNFYDGVSQKEAEEYYASIKDLSDCKPLSYGLNSTLVKENNRVYEDIWRINGKYGKAIEKIVFWLERAINYAENDRQADVIEVLVKYYRTGDLRDFNSYCIEWLADCDSIVDFINGFIEVYDDPLGLKGTWEGLVEYRDIESSRRTRLISNNAQWFEDNSPVDRRFKKQHVNGISANVVCAAMLGGGEYKGIKFLLLTCYDLRFPVWSRYRGDYDAIILVANWPESRQDVWNTLLKARAIENQCYVIGANRTGQDPLCSYGGGSVIIDAKGRVVKQADGKAEQTITADLDINALYEFRSKFPVLDDRDKDNTENKNI